MASRRTAIWMLVVGAALALASRAAGQVPANSNLNYPPPEQLWAEGGVPLSDAPPQKFHDIWPVAPGHVGSDAQPFAPARISSFGNGPRPNVGHFFSYERLCWLHGKPKTAVVGSETAAPPAANSYVLLDIPAINSVDTGKFTANTGWGNRWEVGYMDNDNYGWMVSVLDHIQQSQYHLDNEVSMQFDDPGGLLTGSVLIGGILFDVGKMAVQFDELTQQQITTINGVDLTRMYRPPRGHHGGYFDVLYGVRWLQLYDAYIVTGTNFDDVETFQNPLEDSTWSNVVQNNMVGPQIGIRWFRQRARWVSSVDARFLAAANFQSVKMKTDLGNEIAEFVQANDEVENVLVPRQFLGLGTDQHNFRTEFSPVGEVRVNVSYLVTSKVALKVNWTGIVMGNITRASNRLDYSQNQLITILDDNQRQVFFTNGIGFGVEVNR